MLIDYNQRFCAADPVLFREALIEQMLAVLIGKAKANVLLVGPAGVGKTRVVEDLARRIATGDPLIPDQLKDHTVFELPISDIVAGAGLVGALEAKVAAIVDYASDPGRKVIVFMDEIHQIVGGTIGAKDSVYAKIAQILKPALARGDLRVIGATTTQEARALDEDPAFARRFSRLVVDELTPTQTREVLSRIRTGLMTHYRHQVLVADDVLDVVVRVADESGRADLHRPDSAITLLDRAMANRVLEQRRLINETEQQILEAAAAGDTNRLSSLKALTASLQTSSVPLTETRVRGVAQQLLTGNATKPPFDAAELRAELLGALRGQDAVLDRLVDQLAREELNVFARTTPIAWMLAGASGVGKTEAAKIIAQRLTGQEPITLNMAEYHDSHLINRIIGAPAGYVGSDSNAELPFDSLESNPHRVILLDEFEKSAPAVQRLFLSVLDQGHLRTSRGRSQDFSKALVIATTNAAREALDGASLGFAAAPRQIDAKSLNRALADHFDPELLGRFSLVVGFNPIEATTYADIVSSTYQRQRERILTNRPRLAPVLPAAIPDEELHRIVEATHVLSQGARPAVKAVRTYIEDTLLAHQAQLPTQPANQPATQLSAPAATRAAATGQPEGPACPQEGSDDETGM
jgi:ATP-dependent Clp protease ATP-binding subunit ClpB